MQKIISILLRRRQDLYANNVQVQHTGEDQQAFQLINARDALESEKYMIINNQSLPPHIPALNAIVVWVLS